MARPEHRVPDTTSGARRMAVIVTATLLGGMIAAVGVIGSEAHGAPAHRERTRGPG